MRKSIILFGLVVAINAFGFTYQAHLSDVWYPKEKKQLLKKLQELDDKAVKQFCCTTPFSDVKALIVPHAGYNYSGHVAAAGYRSVQNRNDIDVVFVLGPSHYASFHGVALPTFSDYQNSLGKCCVHTDVVAKLVKKSGFQIYDGAFHPEHAIETQIPLIQKYIPSAKIVPMVVGNVTSKSAQAIAKGLQSVMTDKSLVVVSSDFTHYGKRFNYVPFTDLISCKICELDASIIRALQQKKLDDFYKVCNKTGATVCGKSSLAILMALIEQEGLDVADSSLIAYDTSAKNRRNPDHSVSYVAVSFEKNHKIKNILTPYEQEQLLKISRAKLHSIYHKKLEKPPVVISDKMLMSGGVFVSLYTMTGHGKKLRGCMGQVQSKNSLVDLVKNLTNAAALHDYRFNPLQAREVERTIISISVLTQPKAISSHKKIKLGEHGIMLKCHNAMSVYLPHVATEHKWTLEETLNNLSKKAGLAHNAWKHCDTQLFVFYAQEFKER